MAKSFQNMVNDLLDKVGYTIEELAAILGVSGKSISNYREGGGVQKKTKSVIHEVYEKVSKNDMKKIPIDRLVVTPPRSRITPDGILLKVLLQEFADYIAKKEGVSADEIVSEIENKAKLIAKVADRI